MIFNIDESLGCFVSASALSGAFLYMCFCMSSKISKVSNIGHSPLFVEGGLSSFKDQLDALSERLKDACNWSSVRNAVFKLKAISFLGNVLTPLVGASYLSMIVIDKYINGWSVVSDLPGLIVNLLAVCSLVLCGVLSARLVISRVGREFLASVDINEVLDGVDELNRLQSAMLDTANGVVSSKDFERLKSIVDDSEFYRGIAIADLMTKGSAFPKLCLIARLYPKSKKALKSKKAEVSPLFWTERSLTIINSYC